MWDPVLSQNDCSVHSVADQGRNGLCFRTSSDVHAQKTSSGYIILRKMYISRLDSLLVHRLEPSIVLSKYVLNYHEECHALIVGQDDDYIVLPEVIYSLHARMAGLHTSHAIHLLPPHEHLRSFLSTVHVPTGDGNRSIHTGFAWLGHGSMLHRTEASEFLSLMQILDASEEQMEMADNYFTILSNRVPEVWFDQGLELGGGQPFTVGVEGDERNNLHIVCIISTWSDPDTMIPGLIYVLPGRIELWKACSL